jgi:hypothetical protein
VLESGGRDTSFSRRLFRLLRVLDPDLPPYFRERAVDRQGLSGLAGIAVGGDREAAAILDDVYKFGIVGEVAREEQYAELDDVDEEWRAQVELLTKLREQLGDVGAPLDDEAALRTARARILKAILDEATLEELAQKVAAAANEPALTENAELRALFERMRRPASDAG